MFCQLGLALRSAEGSFKNKFVRHLHWRRQSLATSLDLEFDYIPVCSPDLRGLDSRIVDLSLNSSISKSLWMVWFLLMKENWKTFAYYSLAWLQEKIRLIPANISSPGLNFYLFSWFQPCKLTKRHQRWWFCGHFSQSIWIEKKPFINVSAGKNWCWKNVYYQKWICAGGRNYKCPNC